MSTSTITTSKLELRTAYGPVFRDGKQDVLLYFKIATHSADIVLNVPPRDCTPEEIPVIDLTPLFSPELADRKALALQLNLVCRNTGFFYIKNHGISQDIIANAKKQLLAFVVCIHLEITLLRNTDSFISPRKKKQRLNRRSQSTSTDGGHSRLPRQTRMKAWKSRNQCENHEFHPT